MEERKALGWLGRKITWGFSPGVFDEWQGLGVDRVVDTLVDPDDHGVPERPDPFAEIEFDPENMGRAVGQGVSAWVLGAAWSPRPLETFMDFFWSDYFAVSIRSVRPSTFMFAHMNLLSRHGLGNFRDLLHDVTIDAAMLQFLDGTTNTAGNPNENYGRELLELYSVGVGNFTEDDVKAAAVALTGWVAPPRSYGARFVPRRHDDTPQTLLGVGGVNDVATVIDTVVEQPATHRRVVSKLATAILGPDHDASVTAGIVDRFGEDLELRPVVRSLVELGVDGAAAPSIVEPLPWLVTALRFVGADPERLGRDGLRRLGGLGAFFRTSGQVPLLPPNVGGFPEPDAYLSTSATIARFNLGALLAQRASRYALEASDDVDRLARTLGIVDGFTPTTRDAVGSLPAGPDRIAAALASPDLLVV